MPQVEGRNSVLKNCAASRGPILVQNSAVVPVPLSQKNVPLPSLPICVFELFSGLFYDFWYRGTLDDGESES